MDAFTSINIDKLPDVVYQFFITFFVAASSMRMFFIKIKFYYSWIFGFIFSVFTTFYLGERSQDLTVLLFIVFIVCIGREIDDWMDHKKTQSIKQKLQNEN